VWVCKSISINTGSEMESDIPVPSNIDTGASADTGECIANGTWVVIEYPGKRKNTTLNYIGQVQSINVSTKTLDTGIQFSKKLTGRSEMIFKYPDQDEKNSMPEMYVLEMLAKPAKNSRHHLVF